MVIPKNEINDLLYVFNEFDIINNKKGTITQEMIDFANTEYGIESIRELLGYKVKVHTDGFHKTDGQMVKYTFIFTSPIGVKSSFTVEMCLMVGWNIRKDIKIL